MDGIQELFDKFADTYNQGHAQAIKTSGFSVDYFHEYKIKEVFNYLKNTDIVTKKINILNFGCGIGNSEKYIKKYFPNSIIYSIDISGESIRVAKESNKSLSNMNFYQFDGVNIPLDINFDVIFAAGVFHHIPRDKHPEVLNNIHKKLCLGGFLFIFELNPLNPATMYVAIKNDYKFDVNAKLLNPVYLMRLTKLVGFQDRKIRFTIFFPAFLSLFLRFEKYLYWLPFGAHYYFIGRKF